MGVLQICLVLSLIIVYVTKTSLTNNNSSSNKCRIKDKKGFEFLNHAEQVKICHYTWKREPQLQGVMIQGNNNN